MVNMRQLMEISEFREMNYVDRLKYVKDVINDIDGVSDLRKRSFMISDVEIDLMMYEIEGYGNLAGFQSFLVPGIKMLKEHLDREIALYQAENTEEIALELKRARKGV